VSIPTLTIPCGKVAPGNTCPPLVVPMNKFTKLAGSVIDWPVDAEVRVKSVIHSANGARKECNVIVMNVIFQNMISAGTPVRRTANREPRTANLWLIVAEANAGHRCCNITDRGPQKRLNYNDKGLKLRDARLTKQYLLLFVSHCHSNDTQQPSPSVTPTPFPSTRASQNGPSGAT
jgi:hypothetical protein